MGKRALWCLMLLAGTCLGCASSPTVSSTRNTELARSLNDQAYELIGRGRYAEAERALNQSINADVMFAPARNNLGLVYYHQDKLYLAATEFQNASRLMPSNPEPRNNLGLVFERAGKYSEAVESYQQARKMETGNAHYLGNLARARVRRGDRDEEMKKLLNEVVVTDDRREWRDWARIQLYQMNNPSRPASGPMPR